MRKASGGYSNRAELKNAGPQSRSINDTGQHPLSPSALTRDLTLHPPGVQEVSECSRVPTQAVTE